MARAGTVTHLFYSCTENGCSSAGRGEANAKNDDQEDNERAAADNETTADVFMQLQKRGFPEPSPEESNADI